MSSSLKSNESQENSKCLTINSWPPSFYKSKTATNQLATAGLSENGTAGHSISDSLDNLSLNERPVIIYRERKESSIFSINSLLLALLVFVILSFTILLSLPNKDELLNPESYIHLIIQTKTRIENAFLKDDL